MGAFPGNCVNCAIIILQHDQTRIVILEQKDGTILFEYQIPVTYMLNVFNVGLHISLINLHLIKYLLKI